MNDEILLACKSGFPDAAGDTNYCVITLTRQVVEELLKLIAESHAAKQRGHGFYSIEYFDSTAEWYSDFTGADNLEDGVFQRIIRSDIEHFDPICTSGEVAVVKETEVYWTACHKDGPPHPLESAAITRGELLELLGRDPADPLAEISTTIPRRQLCGCLVLYREGGIGLLHCVEDDTWRFPGGKQEGNETIKDCARRETYEETGIAVTATDFLGIYEHHPGWTVLAYGGRTVQPGHIKEPHKHDKFEWFGLDEIPPNLGANTRRIVEHIKRTGWTEQFEDK